MCYSGCRHRLIIIGVLGVLIAPLRVSALPAQDCDALLLQAQLLLQHDQAPQARQQILSAIGKCPGNAEGYNRLRISYDQEHRYGEARNAYHKAISLDPKQAAFHNNLAVSYYHSGQVAAAMAEFRKALVLDPRNEVAALNLADEAVKGRNYLRATSTARNIRISKLWAPMSHRASGERFDEAATRFGRALAREPDNPAALEDWGTVQLRQRPVSGSREGLPEIGTTRSGQSWRALSARAGAPQGRKGTRRSVSSSSRSD
jgi:tetratricopeptide (TPR) repeat protein